VLPSRLLWLALRGLNDPRPAAPSRTPPSNWVKATTASAAVVAATGPRDVVMHHAAPQIADPRKEPSRVLRLLNQANEHGITSGLCQRLNLLGVFLSAGD
jgi:hypothetical protein